MHTFLSQEKLLLRGQSAGTTITQAEHGWLDLADYQHVVVWLAVYGITTGGTGSVQIAFQTAVRPDESLFVNMSGPVTSMPFAPATGITVTTLMKDVLSVPLARWLRWQVLATGVTPPWDIEFEIFVAASGARRSKRRGTQTTA